MKSWSDYLQRNAPWNTWYPCQFRAWWCRWWQLDPIRVATWFEGCEPQGTWRCWPPRWSLTTGCHSAWTRRRRSRSSRIGSLASTRIGWRCGEAWLCRLPGSSRESCPARGGRCSSPEWPPCSCVIGNLLSAPPSSLNEFARSTWKI